MFRQIIPTILAAHIIGSSVLANPASTGLIERGKIDLANLNYVSGLQNFEAAIRADARDPGAVFFAGVALNRLGRNDVALQRVDAAVTAGYRGPDVDFERGWALVGLERWSEALVVLDRADRQGSLRGETSFLRARAYHGLRDDQRAEAEIREAVRRDPGLREATDRYLVSIGRLAALPPRIGMEGSPSGSPRSAAFSNKSQGLTPTVFVGSDGSYTIGSLSLGRGSNSNVTAFGGVSLAPNEITSTRDSFNQVSLSLYHNDVYGPKDSGGFGYLFNATAYDELDAFDLQEHTAYYNYRHLFRNNLQGSIAVADQYVTQANAAFRNSASVRPALSWLQSNGDILELAYSLSGDTYYFATTPFFDRTGTAQSVSITDYFGLGRTNRLRGFAGYYHLWNDANGSDFDYDSDALFFGLSYPFGRHRRSSAQVFYAHSWDDYRNLNSLAGPNGFLFRRSDENDRVVLQVVQSVSRQVGVYGRYEWLRDDSNVPGYAYSQNVISGGLVAFFR